jgi:hypothetical protein
MPRLGSMRDLLKCSFCGKTQEQVVKIIAGPGVYICDECIDLCNEIIVEEAGEAPARRRPDDDEVEAAARAVNDAVSHLRTLALRRLPPAGPAPE